MCYRRSLRLECFISLFSVLTSSPTLFILCLACFSSEVELDGGKLGDETLPLDKIVRLILMAMTSRNPAFDGIFRSSPYGRINEASLTLHTPLHTMHSVL